MKELARPLEIYCLGPVGEVLKCAIISSIVILYESRQIQPCEVWIHPFPFTAHKLLWWSHHLVFSWTEKECQRFPLLMLVNHRPMQATLVFPIG